jgi:hypothetical protein
MRRHTEAQTSIDFLIGMVIFIGALLFVFQFLSGTVLPFTQGANEKTVTVDRVSDSLYYDEMGTDEKGVIDLRYLYDDSDGEVISEDELLGDLNVDTTRHSINVTVVTEEGVDEDDVETVRITENGLEGTGPVGSGEPVQIGPPPISSNSINRATRVGYVRQTDGTDPETVVVRIRMW